MKNVLEWLEQTVLTKSDKEVFLYEDTSITFGEVSRMARSIGWSLGDLLSDAPEEAAVAVFADRAVTTPAMFLGVVYSGHAYAPIDATLPAARIEKILTNLNPAAILTDEASRDKLEKLLKEIYGECKIPLLVVDYSTKQITGINVSHNNTIEDLTEDKRQVLNAIREKMSVTDPLYIIYTSGSSGNPKGVMTNHLALMTYINAYCKVMGIDESDVLGNQSPLDYIAAIRDIYLPMKTGCSTAIIDKKLFMEPDALFSYMNEKRVSAIGWSVSGLTIPLSLGAFEVSELTYLKKVCFSGAVMPCAVLRVWQEHLPETLFVNQYGPTEATASCTYYVVDHRVSDDEVLPIGKPYDNYKVFLLDENGNKPTCGEQGEICVAGPILALGYCNDVDRTATSFTINPLNKAYPERIYRTGDIGSFDQDGVLHFHGRMDRQVKHMGHRVELDEVECAAAAVGGVAESCCLYDGKKECLWLFYTGELDKKSLVLGLRKSLPGFMVPRKVKQLEELPKLPNGKIDMKKMEEIRNER